jgi:mono/diheme cytochrome c family protein
MPGRAEAPVRFGFTPGTAPIALHDPPGPASCEPCHEAIYDDWNGSRHRVSWTNDLMIAGFVAEPLPFCVNCHAPLVGQRDEVLANRAFYAALDPRSRATSIPPRKPEPTAAHGIHCATCHVRDGQMLAAEASGFSPHDTREVPAMREGDFCIDCHEFPMPVTRNGETVLSDAPMQQTGTEWRAWIAAGGDQTCQDCHMPGGRHVFRGAHDRDWLRQSVRVDLVVRAGRAHFTLQSVDVGHALPTGDLFRHLTLEVLRDGRWQVVDWIGRRFERDAEQVRRVASDTSLQPGEPRRIEVDAGFARWRLVYHYGAAHDETRGLLDPETIRFTLADGPASGPTDHSPAGTGRPGSGG